MKDESTVDVTTCTNTAHTGSHGRCHTNRIHDLHVHKTTYNMAGKTQMMAGIK